MRKALYILGELSDLDVEWLIEHGDRRAISSGEILIRQGEALQFMFIILRGAFAVTDEKLADRELARLRSGEIVGEMSFIESRPPNATVTARENSLVLALPRADLEAQLAADSAFAARFYRALAVFLSDRMRATVQTLGYGKPATLDEDQMEDDELDLNVLDKVHLAGQRFDALLKRLGA